MDWAKESERIHQAALAERDAAIAELVETLAYVSAYLYEVPALARASAVLAKYAKAP